MQAQYFQQQTRQLQLQQQGYMAQQQQRHQVEQGYGGSGYQRSSVSAADSALARRLQEEEMAGALAEQPFSAFPCSQW